MKNIEFHGKITINVIRKLIQKYKNKMLKEIIICINGNKFEDSVERINYSLEIGDYYINKYNIKIFTVDNIQITMLLTPGIPYDLIESYSIYHNT